MDGRLTQNDIVGAVDHRPHDVIGELLEKLEFHWIA
jgi:hypothetical protein